MPDAHPDPADRSASSRRGPSRSGGSSRSRRPPGDDPPRREGGIRLREVAPGIFELVHPRCVEERREDYEEGLEILQAGEPDEAREVLRFGLEGCGDNLWIHAALGRIALEFENDPHLARGHYGYAVDLVVAVLAPNFRGRLDPRRPANRPAYEALDGLARSFDRLGDSRLAAEVRGLGRAWSGSDPRPGGPRRG